MEYWNETRVRLSSLICHTGLTLEVMKWDWNHSGITDITLSSHLEYWKENGIREVWLITHWVDTWSTGMRPGSEAQGSLISHWVTPEFSTRMSLGSGQDHQYHSGLKPGVLEWDQSQDLITYITLCWRMEYWSETGIRMGSLITLRWDLEYWNETGIRG